MDQIPRGRLSRNKGTDEDDFERNHHVTGCARQALATTGAQAESTPRFNQLQGYPLKNSSQTLHATYEVHQAIATALRAYHTKVVPLLTSREVPNTPDRELGF
jgi:hypothetical protein